MKTTSGCFLFFIIAYSIILECTPLFYNIGIYSNCSDSHNRTQFNEDAGLLSNFYNNIIYEVQTNILESIDHFVYETYDVCDNMTYLVEIVQDLALNEKYKYTFSDPYTNKQNVKSSIIVVFAHLPLEMSGFVKSVMKDVLIFDAELRVNQNGVVINPVQNWVEDLVELVRYF